MRDVPVNLLLWRLAALPVAQEEIKTVINTVPKIINEILVIVFMGYSFIFYYFCDAL
jgi:hypothetical protein